MRLITTTLLTLVVLSAAQAFVIPLERITSAPVPTKKSLSKRHEWRHRHGHHWQQGQENQQGQQGQGDQHGQKGEEQPDEQGQNVVTVYTTVTGSPPQQTPSGNVDDLADCKDGKKNEGEHETPETPAAPENKEQFPGPYESPPIIDQDASPAESGKTDAQGTQDASDGPGAKGKGDASQHTGDQGRQEAPPETANDQPDHAPSVQNNPSPEEGKQDSSSGSSGDLKKLESQPVKAAKAGDIGIQAQSQDSGDIKGQTSETEDNSGDAKKQHSPDKMSEDKNDGAKSDDNATSNDNPKSDNDSPFRASHSNVPDAPVPDAKKPEGQPTGGNVLTTDEQQKVLGLHNAIREANGVPKLEWDDKLAKYSAGWTHKCVAHSEHSGGYVARRVDNGKVECLLALSWTETNMVTHSDCG